MKIKANITNCIECACSEVQPDPDPDDWFCDDDVKVVCKAKAYERNITVACRPTRVRAECKIPEWCPHRNPIKEAHP